MTSAFTKALNTFDRIDYVFPIAGLTERQVIPKPSDQKDVRKDGFVKPDMTVLDVNLTGMINLILIAVQAFRSQEARQELGGMKGKGRCLRVSIYRDIALRNVVVCVASTCGLYAMPGVPIYTASKQSVTSITFSQGLADNSLAAWLVLPAPMAKSYLESKSR